MEYLLLNKGNKDNRYSYELVRDGKGENGEKFLIGLIDTKKLNQ